MTSSHQDVPPCQWFSRLAAFLDRRSAPRLAWLFLGAVLARGRRTVTSWIRAAGLSTQFRPCYTTVAAAGKKAKDIAARLVCEVVKPLVAGQARLTLALDDTPTQRYGPFVQGAGIHHNPTPGPAGSPHVYGHIWVVLGLLAVHPAWGVIALPLLARMYVRAKDLPAIDPQASARVPDQAGDGCRAATMGSLLAQVPGQAAVGRGRRGVRQGPVPQAGDGAGDDGRQPAAQGRGAVDGAGASRGRAARQAADLRGEPHRAGQAGRAASRLDDGGLRALRQADEEAVQDVRGDLATGRRSHPRRAGGRAEDGWVAFFCTDPNATVAEILATVADRFALEITFRDCKEIVGAGQQQVRFVWANIGAFHICLWTFTMTEAWAWDRAEDELVDRQASPWDDPEPSPEPRRQASGVASRIAGRRNSRGSTPRGHRGGNSSRRRAVTRLGGMRVHSIAESTAPRKDGGKRRGNHHPTRPRSLSRREASHHLRQRPAIHRQGLQGIHPHLAA